MATPAAINSPPAPMNGPPNMSIRRNPFMNERDPPRCDRSDTHWPVIATTMTPTTSRTTPRITNVPGAHPELLCWSDNSRFYSLLARDPCRRGGLGLGQRHIAGGSGAVEEVIGVEGDDLFLRRDEVDAGALHAADAEIEAVHELHDDHAEHAVVAEFGRRFHLRQAAQETMQAGVGLLAGGGERQQVEQALAQLRILIESDGVGRVADDHVFGDHGGDGHAVGAVA